MRITDEVRYLKSYRSLVDRYLHDSDCVVVEYRRNILGRKLVGGVADQETRLANCTITNNHTSKVRTQVSITIHKHLTRSTPDLSHT